jgi:hypothetical protein
MGGPVLVSEKLAIESNTFVAGAGGGRMGRPLQKTLGEVIRQIGLETPVVAVSGSPGTGKTLLAKLATRACAEMGLSVQRIHRGDLLDVAARERSDVLLVDEADSIPDSTLHVLLSEGDKRPATTTVLLCLPASVHRFSALADAVVDLTRLSQSDTRLYLQERATHAGFRDLFAPAALDLIVDASRGVPRSLWSIASLAYFSAASAGALQISRQNVADALASQITRPELPQAPVPTAPSVKLVSETLVSKPALPPVVDPPRTSASAAVFPGGTSLSLEQTKHINSAEAPAPQMPRSEPEEALVRSTSAEATPMVGTVIKGPGPIAEMPESIAAAPNYSAAPDGELPTDRQKVADASPPRIAHYETIAVRARDTLPVFIDAPTAPVPDRLPIVESIAQTQAEPAISAQVIERAAKTQIESPKSAQAVNLAPLGFARASPGRQSGAAPRPLVTVGSAVGIVLALAAAVALAIYVPPMFKNKKVAGSTAAENSAVVSPGVAREPSLTPAKSAPAVPPAPRR